MSQPIIWNMRYRHINIHQLYMHIQLLNRTCTLVRCLFAYPSKVIWTRPRNPCIVAFVLYFILKMQIDEIFFLFWDLYAKQYKQYLIHALVYYWTYMVVLTVLIFSAIHFWLPIKRTRHAKRCL